MAEETWLDRHIASLAFSAGILATVGTGFFALWLFAGDNYLPAKIEVLGLNLVGDTLSGFAATLAVVWLVVTAVLQRQELKIARAEQKAAREQFEQNQRVIDEQLKALKEQNDNAEQRAIREYKLSLFDNRMKIFEEVDHIGRTYKDDNYGIDVARTLTKISQRSRFLFGTEMEKLLFDLAELFVELYNSRNAYRITEWTHTHGTSVPIIHEEDKATYEREIIRQEEIKRQIDGILDYDARTDAFAKYLTVTDAAKEITGTLNIVEEDDTIQAVGAVT